MDNRTWWRKGSEVQEQLLNVWKDQENRLHYNSDYIFHINDFLMLDRNDMDCVEEQLWAEREILS